jgi:hypothetical protein
MSPIISRSRATLRKTIRNAQGDAAAHEIQPPVVSPPMTCSTVPVMYDESALDARNT